MRHFATAEADVDLYLVAFGDEPAQVAQLDRVVAIVSARAELEFLDLDHFLFFARSVRFLLFFKLELAEVHDAAHRRVGIWNDLDQIHFRFGRHAQCIIATNHAHLFTVRANQAHSRNTNFAIPPVLFFGADTASSNKPKSLKSRRKISLSPFPCAIFRRTDRVS